MKKQLIFYLLYLIFIHALPAGAVKKIKANPINVAYMLAQETDSAKIASTLRYYGYELSSENSTSNKSVSVGLSSGETTTYRHPNNGSIIRYTFKDATKAQPYPKVEVKSKMNSKDIDFTLTDLNFKKFGSMYERKLGQYARTVFQCKHGTGDFLIFHQSRLPQKQ